MSNLVLGLRDIRNYPGVRSTPVQRKTKFDINLYSRVTMRYFIFITVTTEYLLLLLTTVRHAGCTLQLPPRLYPSCMYTAILGTASALVVVKSPVIHGPIHSPISVCVGNGCTLWI